MGTKVITTTFQLRRGNASWYAENNPVLAQGEPAFELDTNKLKIGDGIHNYNDLDYIVDSNLIQEIVDNKLDNIEKINVKRLENGLEIQTQGAYSHAEGLGTIANEDYQHVSGKYNANNAKALFIVGNGTDDTHRSNALEVLKDGDVKIKRNISLGGNIAASGGVQIEGDAQLLGGVYAGDLSIDSLVVNGADGDSFVVDYRGLIKGRVTNIVDLSDMSIDVTQYTLDVDEGTTWADIVNDARYNPLVKIGNSFYRLFKIYNNGTNEIIVSGDDSYVLYEKNGSGSVVKATDLVKFKDDMSGYGYKMVSNE